MDLITVEWSRKEECFPIINQGVLDHETFKILV